MIAAELAYKLSQESEEVFRGVTNAVTQLETPLLNAHFLSKSQQNAQIAFMKHIGTPVLVIDLVLMNIIYLGHMTDAEFSQLPDNIQVAQVE